MAKKLTPEQVISEYVSLFGALPELPENLDYFNLYIQMLLKKAIKNNIELTPEEIKKKCHKKFKESPPAWIKPLSYNEINSNDDYEVVTGQEINPSIEDKIIALGLEKGYLTQNDLNGVNLFKILKQCNRLKIRILDIYESYLIDLKDVNKKIAFCYYMFRCKVLNRKIEFVEFDPEKEQIYKKLIDEYIYQTFSKYLFKGEEMVRIKYGLDNGELINNTETLFKLMNYSKSYTGISKSPMDSFVFDCQKIKIMLNKGYFKFDKFFNQLESLEKYSSITNYKCIDDNTNNEKSYFFSPYNESHLTEGPFICYYTDDGDRQIGWMNSVQFKHSITFIHSDVWGLRFHSLRYPEPHIHYEDGKLYFEFNYHNVGYHGNQYIFECNKPTIIKTYDKGKFIKQTSIDFILDADFSNIYHFDKFDKAECKKVVSDGNVYLYSDDSSEYKLTTKLTYTGSIVCGRAQKNKFKGLALLYNSKDDHFIYENFVNGEPIENGPKIEFYNCDSNQEIRFEIPNNKGNKYVFWFKPFNFIDSLTVSEVDNNGKILNTANISNPFFKKSLEQEPNISNNDDPETTLDSLIGLENVKIQIERLKAICHKQGDNPSKLNLNMVFSGNPGTGKTVVARLLGEILYKEKILPTNKFIEVDRSGLVAKYVGQTEDKVQELIKEAMGGVLFIDEAYALYSSYGEDYGKNALDTLVKAMEDNRGKMCFIFAGYKDPMIRMMNMNQGFRSRVNRFIDFPDYNEDELKEITLKFVSDNGYTLADGVIDEIMEIAEVKSNDKDFANARTIRNILECLYEIQAVRTYEDIENREISHEDIIIYKNDIHFIKPKKKNYVFNLSKDLIKKYSDELKDIEINDKYIQEASVNIKIYENEKEVSEGSGFFISPDGYIGTCAHVIKDEDVVKVVTNIFTNKGKRINKTYEAAVVGYDEENDVGIIKIINPEIEFSYYPLASEDYDPIIMTPITMGGYPLGGERFKNISINSGNVQAINQDSYNQSQTDLIIVDMNACPGNSGSGVVDKNYNNCIGILAGAVLSNRSSSGFKMQFATHIKYLWKLIDEWDNRI